MFYITYFENKPQSSAIDDELKIIEDRGRLFVGDDAVFDAMDGIGDGDDDDVGGGGGWDDECPWHLGIYSSRETSRQ